MEKIKICLVGNASSPHLKKFIGHLSKKFEVWVISHEKSSEERVFYDGDFLPPLLRLRYLRFFGRVFLFRRLIKQIDPDILHIHELNAFGLAAGILHFHPLVISVWGSDIRLRSPIKDWLKKKVLVNADAVLATSNFLKEETNKFFGSEIVTQVTPFGVDLEKFHPGGKSRQDFLTIGFVKQLKKIYGPDLLLEAFIELKKEFKNLKLVFAGDGKELWGLTKRAQQARVSQDVTFLGRIGEKDVIGTLQNLDIFVMPTRVPEAFGVAALEAQATGVSVIAANAGGIPEVLKGGKTGLLFESGSLKDLKSKLRLLIEDASLRSALGSEGRKFVEKNYSLEETNKKMESVYATLYKNFYPKKSGKS